MPRTPDTRPVRRLLPLKVLFPLLLGVALSLAIVVFSELGFRRLEAANRSMAISLETQSVLHEVRGLIVDAETGHSLIYCLTVRDTDWLHAHLRDYLDGHPVVLRPVSSEDAMTADWTRVPYDVLAAISTRITNEVREVNRVVLDITSKPPGTIEWE